MESTDGSVRELTLDLSKTMASLHLRATTPIRFSRIDRFFPPPAPEESSHPITRAYDAFHGGSRSWRRLRSSRLLLIDSGKRTPKKKQQLQLYGPFRWLKLPPMPAHPLPHQHQKSSFISYPFISLLQQPKKGGSKITLED